MTLNLTLNQDGLNGGSGVGEAEHLIHLMQAQDEHSSAVTQGTQGSKGPHGMGTMGNPEIHNGRFLGTKACYQRHQGFKECKDSRNARIP